MKKLIGICALFVLSNGAQAIPTHYFDEITGSGNYQGQVTSSDAWANPSFGLNSTSQEVNLWGLEALAGQSLSLNVQGLNGFTGGFSLYQGEISETDLLYGLFDNSGDTGSARYLAGTTPYGLDSSLDDVLLADPGFYTLVVGGKGFGFDDHYEYSMDVQVSPVPETSTWLLLSTGLLGVVALRRRDRTTHTEEMQA